MGPMRPISPLCCLGAESCFDGVLFEVRRCRNPPYLPLF